MIFSRGILLITSASILLSCYYLTEKRLRKIHYEGLKNLEEHNYHKLGEIGEKLLYEAKKYRFPEYESRANYYLGIFYTGKDDKLAERYFKRMMEIDFTKIKDKKYEKYYSTSSKGLALFGIAKIRNFEGRSHEAIELLKKAIDYFDECIYEYVKEFGNDLACVNQKTTAQAELSIYLFKLGDRVQAEQYWTEAYTTFKSLTHEYAKRRLSSYCKSVTNYGIKCEDTKN